MADDEPTERPGHITGIGGVFFRARDREPAVGLVPRRARAARHRLGHRQDRHHRVGRLRPGDRATSARPGSPTWSTTASTTSTRPCGACAAAGATVAAEIDEDDYGRFAWAVDPEGNRFELWQPAPGR